MRVHYSIPTETGTEMKLRENVVAKLESVSVTENVSGLDPSDFYFKYKTTYEDFVDADGNLLPRVSDEWTWEGKGVLGKDYIPEFVGSEEYDQSFILAKVTYTNTSSEPQTFGVDPELRILLPGDRGKKRPLPFR